MDKIAVLERNCNLDEDIKLIVRNIPNIIFFYCNRFANVLGDTIARKAQNAPCNGM